MAATAPEPHELIAANYEMLYRYAYRLSGGAADAEDLVQETFGRAIPRLGQLRDPESVKPWLYRILRNLYLRRVRDEKRSRVVPLDSATKPSARDESGPSIDPQELQTALDELEESFRTPVILFYFEGFSYRDIAEQMDLPIGTVMSRLARAKTYLRTRLAESVL